MGNQMQKGEDYVGAFAPVPCSTAARVMMPIAAELDLEIHACDFLQAFVQASWPTCQRKSLDSSSPPPSGWEEEPSAGVIYEVLLPLYGSARASCTLRLTNG
eukprot:1021783-Rhodomonas_salina.3